MLTHQIVIKFLCYYYTNMLRYLSIHAPINAIPHHLTINRGSRQQRPVRSRVPKLCSPSTTTIIENN